MKVWNVAGVNTNKKKSENARFLTNNALERYNRHFNGIIPSSHPNLVVFAHALREEAKSVSQRLEDVRKGREKAPTYSRIATHGRCKPGWPPKNSLTYHFKIFLDVRFDKYLR